MRKLVPFAPRVLYRDTDDIGMAIQSSRGQLVSLNGLFNSEVNLMVDGESRIDYKNNEELIKANGKLHKRIIVDNEIKLKEI